MGGWIIKAALNGSALHRPKSEHALVPGSDFQIQLVTPPDRAGLRITDENNCNLCFDYRIKHNERKYLYFLCLITQNISLCSSLASPAPLFARKEKKKNRACEKLLRLWFIGEWRLENSLVKCTTSEIQLSPTPEQGIQMPALHGNITTLTFCMRLSQAWLFAELTRVCLTFAALI